jgi:hypothetical protein
MVFADGGLLGSFGTGGLTIGTLAAYPLRFGVNNAEVARFDTSGNLLIGTTTVGGPSQSHGIQVDGPITNQGQNIGLNCNFSLGVGASGPVLGMSPNQVWLFSLTSYIIWSGVCIAYTDGDGVAYQTPLVENNVNFSVSGSNLICTNLSGSYPLGATAWAIRLA